MKWLAGVGVVLAVGAAAGQTARVAGRDLDGREWALSAPAADASHLLLFVASDCPVSNRYAPEIARILDDYARNVRAFLIYEDPAIDVAGLKRHLGEFYPGRAVTAIHDRDHAIARAAGATITPTAVVYTPNGRAYRGRIDDWYVALGKPRRAPAERTLRMALDAVLAGRAPAQSETQAIGCYIGGDK